MTLVLKRARTYVATASLTPLRVGNASKGSRGRRRRPHCTPHPPPRQAWKRYWAPDAKVLVVPMDILSQLMYHGDGRAPLPVLQVWNQFPYFGAPLDFSAARCGTARPCELARERAAANVIITECTYEHSTPDVIQMNACMEYWDPKDLEDKVSYGWVAGFLCALFVAKVCVCVCVCVCACVSAHARACVCACVSAHARACVCACEEERWCSAPGVGSWSWYNWCNTQQREWEVSPAPDM